MNKFGKITLFVSALTLASTMIVATPTTSHAGKRNDPGAGMKLLDAVAVRPLSLVYALTTSVVYVGTTPLTVPTGMAPETSKYLFSRPWKYTYERRLGSW